MDKEHVKDVADKAKGTIKDAAGKVMGDKELQAEGALQRSRDRTRPSPTGPSIHDRPSRFAPTHGTLRSSLWKLRKPAPRAGRW